jgi:hypothetical protein
MGCTIFISIVARGLKYLRFLFFTVVPLGYIFQKNSAVEFFFIVKLLLRGKLRCEL